MKSVTAPRWALRLLLVTCFLGASAAAQWIDIGNVPTSGGEVVVRGDEANKVEFGIASDLRPFVRLSFPPPLGAVVSQDTAAITKLQQMITSSSGAWFPVVAKGTAYVRSASIFRAVFPPCSPMSCAATVEPYQGLIDTVQVGDIGKLKTLTADATTWMALADQRTVVRLTDVRAVTFSCAADVCTRATVAFSSTTSQVFSDPKEISQLGQIVGYPAKVSSKRRKPATVISSSTAKRHPAKH